MTNKEELIRAAETLKNYCDDYRKEKGQGIICVRTCPLFLMCNALDRVEYLTVGKAAKLIIDKLRCSDD